MKRQYVIPGVILIAALGACVWWQYGRSTAKPDAAEAGADDVSVLVRTEPVREEVLPLSMSVFGDVATGLPEALSFPQAGQLLRLPVVVGQQVRRGELIAVLGSDPAARSTYAQAQNALTFAQRELRRVQDLLALQLATQSQVDAASKQLQDAQATLAAQSRLGGAQASARLVAPFDGVVAALPVAQGERVAAGATVAQLGRTDNLRVLLSIEPARRALVKPGMPVAITPVQDNAVTVSAMIAGVQNLVDPKTQMVSAVVTLPAGKGSGLFSGMRVQAAIRLGQRQAWAVPRQAVLSDDQGAYLYQVAGKRARRVEVVKLMETGQLYGVEGKVDAKLPIVVLGNYELGDGMRVREEAR